MLVRTSTSLNYQLLRAIADVRRHRYHVGRHVANLQVVNTYEGTYVSTFFGMESVFYSANIAFALDAGYTHTYSWKGFDGHPGVCKLVV